VTAPTARPAEGDLLALTSIRGVAAWWVVLFHMKALSWPLLPGWSRGIIASGNLAVDLFFVLSGFVIYLNYGERLTSGRMDPKEFLFRRFARVYPLHLLMLIGFAGYAIGALLFGSAQASEQGWPNFFGTLVLVQAWGFSDALKWNMPAWSISAEAFAYVLFPTLLVKIAPRRRRSWVLIAAIVLLGLSIHGFFWVAGYHFPNAVSRTGLARCLAQFAMGMMVCELWQRSRGRTGVAAPLLALAGLGGIGWWWIGAPVVPIAWAALVLGLALLPARGPLAWRPAVWLGKISYATYLSHYLILTLFKLLFVEEGKPVTPALLLLYLASVLAASALLYHGFERPAQDRLLAWWKRRRPVPELAPAE
jgi:peptidoglycan/LPS O-acetylase OafA/YrhL